MTKATKLKKVSCNILNRFRTVRNDEVISVESFKQLTHTV